MSHLPKQAALEAYAAGLLSQIGEQRVQRHLAACDVCNDTLHAVRAYNALRTQASQAFDEAAVELDWARMERALDRPLPVPAPPVNRTGRLLALAWPVLAVAATVLIGWIGLSGQPTAEPNQRAAEVAARPVAEASVMARVTLLSGRALIELAGTRAPITLDTDVPEGSVLITEPGAELHVAVGSETGFALHGASELRVTELREGATALTLVRGVLGSQVEKRSPGQRYQVHTGDIRAEVRGTRFTVEQGAALDIYVHEGEVAVMRGDELLSLLSSGQRYEAPSRTRDAAPPEPHVHALVRSPADLRSPARGRASTEPASTAVWDDGLSTLEVPATPALRAWLIDGASFSTEGALAMRLPPGPLTLSFADLRGQVGSFVVSVDEGGTTLSESDVATLLPPREPRTGHLDPAEIAAVVRGGLQPLRRCYERSLKVTPSLAGKLTLAIRVGADGRVLRAQAESATGLSPELARCIEQEAGRLRFPKPRGGAPLSFELPLNLKSGP